MVTDEIRTARLLLRGWRDDDREPFAAMNADPEVMRFFPAPLTREQSDALVVRIEAHVEEHGFGLWALEADGHFAGFTGIQWTVLDGPDSELEVGWRLARWAWGHGWATEAGRCCPATWPDGGRAGRQRHRGAQPGVLAGHAPPGHDV